MFTERGQQCTQCYSCDTYYVDIKHKLRICVGCRTIYDDEGAEKRANPILGN